MSVGYVIKKSREELGYSQAELAKMSDITNSAMSMIESGKRFPETPTLLKISKSLGVTMNFLFGYIDVDVNKLDVLSAGLMADFLTLPDSHKCHVRELVKILKDVTDVE